MKESPSQTAGPFLHIGMAPASATLGHEISLGGTLFDAEGQSVTDAMIELWQADGKGRYPGEAEAVPGFSGWGRCATDADGNWRFETVRPGTMPFVSLWIVARGVNLGLHTRLYFPESDCTDDPVMASVPETRRFTLIAKRTGEAAYHLDIHLGGSRETVFFDV